MNEMDLAVWAEKARLPAMSSREAGMLSRFEVSDLATHVIQLVARVRELEAALPVQRADPSEDEQPMVAVGQLYDQVLGGQLQVDGRRIEMTIDEIKALYAAAFRDIHNQDATRRYSVVEVKQIVYPLIHALSSHAPEDWQQRLADQRAKGWPDMHPEDICHRCGGKNMTWWTPAEVWNPIMQPDGPDAPWRWNEIICPQCFAELFEQQFPDTGWRIEPSPDTRGGKEFYAIHPAPPSEETEWEHAVAEPDGWPRGSFDGLRDRASVEAWWAGQRELQGRGCYLIRRRPAGQWSPVPEGSET